MAPKLLSTACVAIALVSPSSAFVPTSRHSTPQTALYLFDDKAKSDVTSTRRGFFDSVALTSLSIAGASAALLTTPAPALAYGLKKANDRLASYGLPPLPKVPDGFSALSEIYGKGRNRSPLLVAFGFPVDWVVVLPSQDVNGEDGTIQVGEYAKGDTATFFVLRNQGKVDNIQDKDKKFFESAFIAAISQKGDNLYQDFKITKLVPVTVDGQSYVLADFQYTLLTQAGFEIARKGVGSITSVGDGVQLLWAASVTARFKNKTEGTLRSIVESFRCYADGLNFSADLVKDDFYLAS
mmetsp:Transcript_16906/g.35398  ORF Transcript_16906/g.35398 Transcript_16906/m.35398 type:complete len:296 (+) Transcript_16906:152-1039(+)